MQFKYVAVHIHKADIFYKKLKDIRFMMIVLFSHGDIMTKNPEAPGAPEGCPDQCSKKILIALLLSRQPLSGYKIYRCSLFLGCSVNISYISFSRYVALKENNLFDVLKIVR